MQINLPQRPNPNDAANPALLARHMETIVQALKKNLSFADNFSGSLLLGPSGVGVSLTHNTPTLVDNPLPQRARPVGAIALNSDTQQTPQVTQSQTALVNGVLTAAPTGKLWLTAIYPVTSQVASVSRVRSNAISLTSGVVANVATTPSFTLLPGAYDLSGAVGFVPGATTTLNQIAGAICATSGAIPATDVGSVPTSGEYVTKVSFGGIVPATTTGVEIHAYRTNVPVGSSLTLFLTTQATFGTSTLSAFGSMEARLVGAAPGTTANVTVFLVGA